MTGPTQGKGEGVEKCSRCAYYEEAGIEAQHERDALRADLRSVLYANVVLLAEMGQFRAENTRLRGEAERLRTVMAVCGATIDPDGSLVLDGPKWNAAHYCKEHRGTQWVDDCAACLRARVHALEEGLSAISAECATGSTPSIRMERIARRARALLKTADGEGGGE